MIDDLLDARDDLEALLDEALPALEARPTAEGAEVLAVLLVAPLRRGGPDARMRRLVVRGLARRATPAAAAVLAAVAVLGDEETAARARETLDKLAEQGVAPTIAGIGETALVAGWRVWVPPADGLAVRVRRPSEPEERLLKLWLEPGADAQPGTGGLGALLAGGWTDPLASRRLEKDRDRFFRMAQAEDPEPLDADGAVAALDALVRRAHELDAPVSEGVALILPQLRRAAGGPDWPAFAVVAEPGRARPRR